MTHLELSDPIAQTQQPRALEQCIRQALASRQMSSRLEAEIQSLVLSKSLSRIEKMLLDILNDAVKEGCVNRVSSSS